MVQPAVDSNYGFNPNVIAGQAGNAVRRVLGATIAGGGGCNPGTGGICSVAGGNRVTGSLEPWVGALAIVRGDGTVAGGYGNTANGVTAPSPGASATRRAANTAPSPVATTTRRAANCSTVAGDGNTASGFASFAAGAVCTCDP